MSLKWVEGFTSVKEIVKTLATTITMTYDSWTLKHPSNVSSIEDKAIIGVQPFKRIEQPDEKEFYLMIERPSGVLNYVNLTIGDKLNEAGDGFEEGRHSQSARYAWYRDTTDVEGVMFDDWLPIRYWLNIDGMSLNLVVQGEPSVDAYPYNNFLFSWAYVGALESYEGADRDVDGNFCLTVGSDIEPDRSNMYGINTGTGVVDIIIAYSRAGAPYQAHMPKFKTDNPYGDKCFIGPSEWTHKYHFDEITAVHKYDRERGKLRNVLIGDRSAIHHNDELIWKKGDPEEEVYRAFQINSPYWMAEESANPLYGIILKKS